MEELQVITQSLDTRDLRSSVETYIDRISNVALNLQNPGEYDSLRTDINKFIKTRRELIKEVFDKWDSPLKEYISEYVGLLDNLDAANKDFSNKILETKKLAFMYQVKDEYNLLVRANVNGEYIPFEEVYDPSWYNCKSRKEWIEKLVAKYEKLCKMRDATKTEYVIEVECTLELLAEIETLLLKNGTHYRIERK